MSAPFNDPGAWWWVTSRHDIDCDECGELIPRSSDVGYRFWPETLVCELCVESLGLQPTRSAQYRRDQAAKQ